MCNSGGRERDKSASTQAISPAKTPKPELQILCRSGQLCQQILGPTASPSLRVELFLQNCCPGDPHGVWCGERKRNLIRLVAFHGFRNPRIRGLQVFAAGSQGDAELDRFGRERTVECGRNSSYKCPTHGENCKIHGCSCSCVSSAILCTAVHGRIL